MAYENYKTDARYMNKDADGVPRWAQIRHIDGHDYPLLQEFAQVEDAQQHVAQLREDGYSAQCFSANVPKFGLDANEPVRAAVYGFPRGSHAVVTVDSVSVEAKPKAEKKPKADKKTSKKSTKAEKAE